MPGDRGTRLQFGAARISRGAEVDRTNLELDGTLWETDTPTGTMTVLREIYGTDFETARDTLCRRFRRFLNRGELRDASFLYATLRLYDEPASAELVETAEPPPGASDAGDGTSTPDEEGSYRTRPVTPWQSMSCLG